MRTRKMRASAALLAVLGGLSRAAGQPPPVLVAPPPPAPVPVMVPPPPLAPAAPLPAGGCPCPRGDGSSLFALDVMLGMQLGLRGQVAVWRNPDGALMVEGFYGAMFDKLDSGEAAGAGGRYYLRRTDREGCNSILVGPGVDVDYHFHHQVWLIAPTVDVAWAHAIGDLASWEIGLNFGVGIGLNHGTGDRDEAGRVTPLISLFTGLRF
jgi:hypothetical protein